MHWCWGPEKGEWKGEPHPSNALFFLPAFLSFYLALAAPSRLPPSHPQAGLCLQEFTVCSGGAGPVAMETASLGAGRSGADHGRSMHQCKAPRDPPSHPAPRSPSAPQGLGVGGGGELGKGVGGGVKGSAVRKGSGRERKGEGEMKTEGKKNKEERGNK